MPMPGEQQRREKERQDAYQRAKERHFEWLKSHSEKMWADTRQRNTAIEKRLREKDDRGAGRGGAFGRLVVYVVLVIIALAVYRQFHHSDQQGPAKTESTAAPGLALALQTVSWLSPEMLICEGSSYGCSVGNKFIAAHRYQVLKCVYGGTYYLFWKDNTPPGWDRFINGNAFQYFGKSVLAQCPTNSAEALRVF